MSDIPEDIMEIARSLSDGSMRAAAIARAILAERERCAGIVKDMSDRSLNFRDRALCLELMVLIRSAGHSSAPSSLHPEPPVSEEPVA
jgi:hypothetical protein